jgi:CRISPR-associated protein Csx17
LFQRGLAKLGGRPAQAPHEFAVAALDAGVDSGVGEFDRFELRQTTSSQVYEAIPRPRIHVGCSVTIQADSHRRSVSPLLVHLIESGWMDRLPFEPRKSNQKGKFVGLRGPIESAVVQIAERPDDAERWRQLLLRLASAQARIDRNKGLRERCVAIQPLSPDWCACAWPDPPPEIAIARAIASIGWHFGHDAIPVQSNVFGVTLLARGKEWRAILPKIRPAQSVWGPGNALQMLLDVAQRRLTDAEGLPRAPFAGTQPCSAALVQQLLNDGGDLDVEEIAKWIPPLSLIDWSNPPRQPVGDDALDKLQRLDDGTSMLHALVRPLFHVDRERKFEMEPGTPLFRPDQLPKANLLRRLFHLLRFGQIDEAVQVLRDRYLAVGRAIVMPPDGLVTDGERIAAALLIPMSNQDVRSGLKRWLQPSRNR